MAKDFSFDVVSDYDLAEMTNAVDQAQREIMTRYDFKNTAAKLEFGEGKASIHLEGDSQNQLNSIVDVLQTKLVKRGVSLKVLDLAGSQAVQGGKEMRWDIKFRKGLDQEKAKKITKVIRDQFPKAKTQIQGEEVRVSSASKDDLQGIIAVLKQQDFDFPLDFQNYR